MTLASFNSSPKFAFVASEKYARNLETEGIVDVLQGVEISFSTPGPLSFGIFDMNVNRFFMQELYDRLVATEYPPPFETSLSSIDHWVVTAQSNASGQMINITYTKAFTTHAAGGGGAIAFARNSQPINEIILGRCVYQVQTALNSNPPKYKSLVAAKFKCGLIGKKFPICINSMVNGVASCEASSVTGPSSGDGWIHTGTGIEVLPAIPDFSSLNTSWYGARRADIHLNDGAGLTNPSDPNLPGGLIGPTPPCCAI